MLRKTVEACDDLRALAVCGSWARGDARPDSDLDLLIVADDPPAWRCDQGWVAALPYDRAGCAYRSHRTATYGAVWSAHVDLDPDAAVELSFAPAAWACTDPLDLGTYAVVSDAFRIVVDKDGMLAPLVAACATPD